MKRREDGAVREVMKELLRSDLRFHKTDCGRSGAMTAWGLKDTSSRPAKDLGGTLRRTSKTTPRSYDNRTSGDLLCSHRQGCVANVTRIESYQNRKRLLSLLVAFYSKSDTMRWQFRLPAYSCDFESTMITLIDWREYGLWKNSLHEKKLLKS